MNARMSSDASPCLARIGDFNVVGNLGGSGDNPPDANPHEYKHAMQVGSATAVRIGQVFAAFCLSWGSSNKGT
jgi:hypothetical protein